MADYDVGKGFAEIEDELISSMTRNLKQYKVEEVTESMQWSQWQAEQLKALEEYKRKAVQKYGAKFSSINDKIEERIRTSYQNAAEKQEREILKNIGAASQNTVPFTSDSDNTGIDSIVSSTENNMRRAESAMLRMANDRYSKTISNAQMFSDMGAGKYEKAIDMTTKDYLSSGINCIEYKNGRRVNIRTYAEMATRTAEKRACLQGEGDTRKKWGIHTVILDKRTNACPLCSQFVGKVIVDDVWSGGTAEEAAEKGYLLMSECIKQGLYHPNCQDSHTTYFEGTSDEEEPEKKKEISSEEQELNEQLYDAEQRQNYCERQRRRFERLGNYSLDEGNKREYSSRCGEWKRKTDEITREVTRLQADAPKDRFAENSKPKFENALTAVKNEILKSPKFRKQIDKLGEGTKVSREIYQRMKDALQHRSGTEYEDLIFIDSITGKSLVRNDYNVPRQCIPSKQMMKMVEKSEPHTVIAIHNHPNSSVPSISDINSAWKKKYKYGIIACHNGNIYKYRVLGEYNSDYVDMSLDKMNTIIYNKEKLAGQFETKMSQALSDLKENNIEMEILLWK